MKKKVTLIYLFTIVLLLSSTINVQADSPTPPQPKYPAPDLIVWPSSQNIGPGPGGVAVWNFSIQGGSGTYKVTLTFGDSCGSITYSNIRPGEVRQISHTFDCGYSTIYNQTWKAVGFGGPIYEYSVVTR